MWVPFTLTPLLRVGCTLCLTLLLLTLPLPGQAAGLLEPAEIPPPACPAPAAVDTQLALMDKRVQATLSTPLSPLPAVGCPPPAVIWVPEELRPPFLLWRDVKGQIVQANGQPDPEYTDPYAFRLQITHDGRLHYAQVPAVAATRFLAFDLELAWGTTGADNDLTVLDILRRALRRHLTLTELGAQRDDSGRMTTLDWRPRGRGVMYPPDMRMTWELPSELGQLYRLTRLALGGPLLTGTIPPELGGLQRLQKLHLLGSQLTGTIPPQLSRLPDLRTLELHSNQLTTVPKAIGQFRALQFLGLNHNRLTDLPPEIGHLSQLVYLGLAGNQLTSLSPAVIGLPQLFHLELQDNHLIALPTLALLQRLEYLDVSGNRLAWVPVGLGQGAGRNRYRVGSDVFVIPVDQLGQLAVGRGLGGHMGGFWYLDLSDNRLTELPTDFRQLQKLVYLDLSDNQLTNLPPGLDELPQLEQLDLWVWGGLGSGAVH